MILATVLFIILAFVGPFSWWHGGLMLAVLAAILLDQAWTARRVSRVALATEDLNGVDTSMPGWKITLYLLFGLVGLPLGAKVLVVNAEIIAREFGVPETAIGLTLIVAAPYCAALLGDAGAEIIKVENPMAPDALRGWSHWIFHLDNFSTRIA